MGTGHNKYLNVNKLCPYLWTKRRLEAPFWGQKAVSKETLLKIDLVNLLKTMFLSPK